MADDQDYSTSGMIALLPDAASAAALAVDGGDPVEELHLTLAYLGDQVDTWPQELRDGIRSVAERFAADNGPTTLDVFAHAAFNPNGDKHDPCAVYLATGDLVLGEYDQAQAGTAEVLAEHMPDVHPVFVPHITAGYGLDVALLDYTGPVTFDRVRLALGDEVTDYPLGEAVPAPTKPKDEDEAKPAVPKVVTGPAEDEDDPEEDEEELAVTFPVLAVEGIPTGDGRFIEPGALTTRTLPLSILAQTRNPDGGGGHDAADIIGTLLTAERVPGPEVISQETGLPFPEGTFVWRGTGVIDGAHPASRLVRKGYLRGNSVDLSDVEVEFDWPEGEDEEDLFAEPDIRMTKGKLAATTLVPVPAFADAYVLLDGETDPVAAVQPDALAASGYTVKRAPAWRIADTNPLTASAAAPVDRPRPPTAHYTDPGLTEETPLTINGTRVYGHLAVWSRKHIAFGGQAIHAPRSRTDYALFNTGAVRTVDEDGTDRIVAVGHLTMDTGHPGLELSADAATRHYDHTGFAWARVQAGEDEFGIWVHGELVPGITPEQVDTALAHALSGDWRPVDGGLELVAALSVNTPGIPVPRARVASGAPLALVAAGALAPRVTLSAAEHVQLVEQSAQRTLALLDERELTARRLAAAQRVQLAQLAARRRAVQQRMGRDLRSVRAAALARFPGLAG